MKTYEGLFILNTSLLEEGIKETIDKITLDIANQGGKVESIEKLENRPFARVSNRRNSSGYYFSVVFKYLPENIEKLRESYRNQNSVFRVMFQDNPNPTPLKAATPAVV